MADGTAIQRHEVLAFKLGKEEYGIDILAVQEIRSYEATTHIANVPDYVKGIINLRGVIVPIVDMRLKFRVGEATYDASTVVVIVNIDGRIAGIVVDAVSDVVMLAPEEVKPAPDMGNTLHAEYLTGLATLEQRMLILIDVIKLMSSSDMALLDKVAA